MGTSLKLSDDLVNEARQEAETADRSLTSQVEHWARLGRVVENALRHEDVIALKRAVGPPLAPPARRALVAAMRQIAADATPPDLAAALKGGRTVYQDAGGGRIERIERDGTRTTGRLIGRRFQPEEPARAARHK